MSSSPRRRCSSENLVWLDLEMTGLDVQRDAILQAALIVSDGQLRVLEEYACDIHQPEESLAGMTPVVREMHEKNGLTDRVRASRTTLADAERELVERVSGWCTRPATLCGNSVHYDKRFLERWMPELDELLHYRVLDVSSLKIIAQRWYGSEAVFPKPRDREHDALVDIRNSIAELAHYRQHLLA